MGRITMLNILYEDNHVIVVEKPVNIPVQADDSNDLDLLSMIKEYIKVKYEKPGNVYVGLVHRLDRPVGGVMVFAKTSKAASRLSDQIRRNEVHKEYTACLCGQAKESDVLCDYMRKNEKTNTSYVCRKEDANAKFAKLSYECIKRNETFSLVKIHLETGRSHQIRVQFSSRSLPLYGDQRYNKKAKVGEQIALYATSLTFQHPTTKEELTFHVPLPKHFPLK